MSSTTTKPTYYLAIGGNTETVTYGISDSWTNVKYSDSLHGVTANGTQTSAFWVVILDRTNPYSAQNPAGNIHFSKVYTPEFSTWDQMFKDIDEQLAKYEGNCILLMMGLSRDITTWGFDKTFISKLEDLGADDLYTSLIQKSLLLKGSAFVTQKAFYALASIPYDDDTTGIEIGGLVGNYVEAGDTMAAAIRIAPVEVEDKGFVYSLQYIG